MTHGSQAPHLFDSGTPFRAKRNFYSAGAINKWRITLDMCVCVCV